VQGIGSLHRSGGGDHDFNERKGPVKRENPQFQECSERWKDNCEVKKSKSISGVEASLWEEGHERRGGVTLRTLVNPQAGVRKRPFNDGWKKRIGDGVRGQK